ncbi:hypothetical protein Lal_00033300 [Lupinus albus]|nr:hypothetical protein Lal_00033300 [Lupinus albus]
MARALQLCGVNGNVYVTERISMNCETGIGFGKFVRAGLCSARGVVVSSEKMTSLLSVTCKATGTKSDVIEKKNNVIVENDENFGEIERSSSYTCVMKFGGSSVASAERMREVAALILSFPQERPIIVLSAMGKTTNKLLMYDAFEMATYPAVAKRLHGDWVSDPAIPIVTGFLGKARKSCAVTTLGRGGSDLTATTIGKALGLPEIQVWKDVDGVLTCDPNICPQATPVPYLTFDEAAELAYFGAQVLHPQSMRPARESDIPVRVKNSFNPKAPGTLITKGRDMSKAVLTSIVLKSNVTMFDIVSTRMLGQYGFLAKVFLIFEDFGISVDVVATSEVSISLTLDPSKLWIREIIQQASELDHVVEELEKIAVVNLLKNRSIISLIGNVQMSSLILEKVNISLVVNDSEAEQCVRALHSIFFESELSELKKENETGNGSVDALS